MPLQVELVSPERVLFSGEASMVIARTLGGGDIAFLPGHAPFIGALDTWTVTVRLTSGPDEIAAVHGGFVSVSNDRVIVLSDVAELASQIDVERARRAHAAAEAKVMRDDDAEAVAALSRAHARLNAAGVLLHS
ncbi:MAG: F0F1 ATP synthase subunit epsilon [Acidimicrobiales bacterium]|jgi:F-type H+-transporting ATPase subunit epsilon|nr:F0F1 ATP synthase subunit epsilon [Acidimicrobiales bacterium]